MDKIRFYIRIGMVLFSISFFVSWALKGIINLDYIAFFILLSLIISEHNKIK